MEGVGYKHLCQTSFQEFMKSFSKIEPLTNYQIFDKCTELKIKNFKGVFMRDELKGQPKKRECIILNLDDNSGDGTHWVCLFIKDGVAIYFDSFGQDPPLEVLNYCKGLTRYCGTDKIQKYNEVICGHYSIFMLYRLSNGCKFFDTLDEIYRYNH